MIRGIDASRRGMAAEQTRTDVIANNVANVNTDGFKRSIAVTREFDAMVLERLGDSAPGEKSPVVGTVGNGAAVDQVVAEKSNGALRFTDSPLDLAIIGAGQFAYQLPDGTTGYTRNGAFRQDGPSGRLLTADGHPVLVGGAPVGSPGRHITLAADGTVLLDGQPAGKPDVQGADANTTLQTRVLEASNANLISEMTDLTVVLRSYQINQRALVMQDQTLARAVSDIGKV